MITAYCPKTKTKDVPMLNVKINVKMGRYVASGNSAAGNPLANLITKTEAEDAINAGEAKKGTGWA